MSMSMSIDMSAILVSIPAPVPRNTPASATTAASPTATIGRSRRRRYSSANNSAMGSPSARVERQNFIAASSRNPLRRLHDIGGGAVRALGVELDDSGRVDVGGGNFGGFVLKAFGHHDLNAMGSARHRVLDRLDLGLQHALGDETCDAPILVE